MEVVHRIRQGSLNYGVKETVKAGRPALTVSLFMRFYLKATKAYYRVVRLKMGLFYNIFGCLTRINNFF